MTDPTLSVPSHLFIIPVNELATLLYPLGVVVDTKWSKRSVGSTTFRLAKEREGSNLYLQVWEAFSRPQLYDRYNHVCGDKALTTSIILPTSPNHRLVYELSWAHPVPEDKAKGRFPVRGVPVHMFQDGTLVRTKEFRALRAEANLLRGWGVL